MNMSKFETPIKLLALAAAATIAIAPMIVLADASAPKYMPKHRHHHHHATVAHHKKRRAAAMAQAHTPPAVQAPVETMPPPAPAYTPPPPAPAPEPVAAPPAVAAPAAPTPPAAPVEPVVSHHGNGLLLGLAGIAVVGGAIAILASKSP